MSEIESPEDARPDSVYVVQIEAAEKMWQDIATVSVPPKAHRRGVIAKALTDAGIKPSGEPPRVRVLDARSAEVFEPEAFQPEPEWRVG